jgi:hypothetical protein
LGLKLKPPSRDAVAKLDRVAGDERQAFELLKTEHTALLAVAAKIDRLKFEGVFFSSASITSASRSTLSCRFPVRSAISTVDMVTDDPGEGAAIDASGMDGGLCLSLKSEVVDNRSRPGVASGMFAGKQGVSASWR